MYLKFRLRKMSLVQLERRFCMPVHILTSPDFEIPTYVLAYLSKGGKFVADRCASSAAKVLTSVSALERSLNTAVFFDRHALEPTFFRRCRLRTASKPKEDPIISAYGRLLREELSSYSPRELVKNEDFIDKAARKWLWQHRREISVVDCDKNLGDAIVPKHWVRQECLRLLEEASYKVSRADFLDSSANLKFLLDSFLQQSVLAGSISTRLAAFIRRDFGSNNVGSFRLRVKLHKSPVVGRPIMNLSKAWFSPLSVFLTEALAPMLHRQLHVIQSSQDLVKQLVDCVVPPGFALFTFDVRNLYPSIDQRHFLSVIASKVRFFWSSKPSFGAMIVKLIEFLLAVQYVEFEADIWHVQSGLPTGLQASVVFANLYLAAFDDFLVQRCSWIFMWKRYIDDAFAIFPLDSKDECLQELNIWHPNIVWEMSGSGMAVNFLDLSLTLHMGDHSISFETFRKPQNAYLYLPRTSCHPPSVFKALVIGETQRLHRTNRKNAKAFAKHLDLFLDKLQHRGYCKEEARRLAMQTVKKLECPTASQQQPRKFFFRQQYSSSLNVSVIKRVLKKHASLVQSRFTSRVEVFLSYSIQCNNFRRNFSLNWH